MQFRGVGAFLALYASGHIDGTEALQSKGNVSRGMLESYTFAQFTQEYGRNYVAGSSEHSLRAAHFATSLSRVRSVNVRNKEEERGWVAGVHAFMDWTPEERAALLGYKPSRARHSGVVALQLDTLDRDTLNSTFAEVGGVSIEDGPGIRNQGNCGSCWAISAAEAVEAQLIRSGASTAVSAQALVNCVPNPQHCGGSGGCDGATGELAYAYMRDHGIPTESDLPYTGRAGLCDGAAASGRVLVSGFSQLPSNQAAPLMSALAEQGPVVVAVDGGPWFDYDGGVFDGCDRDAVLNHAVLAKGWGRDGARGYWLIQNSWGREWGEQGHIRLQKLDGEDEDAFCGVDRKPQDGLGCDGGPPEITVCGMCGMLYDPVIPTGVHIE